MPATTFPLATSHFRLKDTHGTHRLFTSWFVLTRLICSAMAQLLSNEDEVLEAFDPSIAAARRFRCALLLCTARLHTKSMTYRKKTSFRCDTRLLSSRTHSILGIPSPSSSTWPFDRWPSSRTSSVRGRRRASSPRS